METKPVIFTLKSPALTKSPSVLGKINLSPEDQIRFYHPTKKDEWTLRRLSAQLKMEFHGHAGQSLYMRVKSLESLSLRTMMKVSSIPRIVMNLLVIMNLFSLSLFIMKIKGNIQHIIFASLWSKMVTRLSVNIFGEM